ncbi:uncharacterized protein KD926_000717 [Aspergillus affinis]|uniref:uncharacterized protein n=1 Tax=Aspergillus affinis TaxID=1070780 RepID=UPI0022FE362E|nr:uncharacterized protein KD926_000717 [Aspergillus affinis]KAI9037211.1 hypothetical protein KD926_000717 [Aspergillus affinis]
MPNSSQDQFDIARVCNNALVGTVIVRTLDSLVFEDENVYGTRAPIAANVRRLLHRFQKEGCRREDPLSWIPAELSPQELHHLLSLNSLSAFDKDEPREIKLPEDAKICCLQGQHRVSAAWEWLEPNDQWWVINLFDSSKLTPEARRRLREGDSSSREYSDGEIYRNIRYYQKQGDQKSASGWLARWSESKCNDFRQLYKPNNILYRTVRDKLDDLLPFAGLWPQWQMGTHLVREHCVELTLGHPEWLDSSTVEHLQGRFPKLSKLDRKYVDYAFQEHLVFSSITDTRTRSQLHQAATEFPRIIPSLKTFLENAKYLKLIMQVLKNYLGPLFKGTLREGMRSCYVHPDNDRCPIQVSENTFIDTTIKNNDRGFLSAYRQVCLFAMRHFFGLTNSRPLGLHRYPGSRQQPDTHELWKRFNDLASKLGFVSPKRRVNPVARARKRRFGSFNVRQPAGIRIVKEPPEFLAIHQFLTRLRPADLFEYSESVLLEEASRICETLTRLKPRSLVAQQPTRTTDEVAEFSLQMRCGITDAESFFADQPYLFLNNIYESRDETPRENLTGFAIKQDMFIAFFGDGTEDHDQDMGRSSWRVDATVDTRENMAAEDTSDPMLLSTALVPHDRSLNLPAQDMTVDVDMHLSTLDSQLSMVPTPTPLLNGVIDNFPQPSTPSMSLIQAAPGVSTDVLGPGHELLALQGNSHSQVGHINNQRREYCTFTVNLSPGAFLAQFNAQVKASPGYLIFYNVEKREIACLLRSSGQLQELLVSFGNVQWYARPQRTGDSFVLVPLPIPQIPVMLGQDVVIFFSTRLDFRNNLLMPDATQLPNEAVSMPAFNEQMQNWHMAPGEIDIE